MLKNSVVYLLSCVIAENYEVNAKYRVAYRLLALFLAFQREIHPTRKARTTARIVFLLLFCRGSPEALFGHGDVRFLSGTTGKPRPFGASLKWARSARSFLDLEAGEVCRSL